MARITTTVETMTNVIDQSVLPTTPGPVYAYCGGCGRTSYGEDRAELAARLIDRGWRVAYDGSEPICTACMSE